MAQQQPVALRVAQLDAHELDDEYTQTVLSQCQLVTNHLPDRLQSWFERFHPELTLAVRSLLYYHSVLADGSSLGQQLTGLHLAASRQKRYAKLILYAASVLVPYALQRLPAAYVYYLQKSGAEPDDEQLSTAYKRVARLTSLCRAISLAHFCWFIYAGGQRSLAERLAGLRVAHDEPPTMDSFQPDLSVLNRELLWHGFADVLAMVLPLWPTAKRYARRLLAPAKSAASVNGESRTASLANLSSAPVECAYCAQPAIVPHVCTSCVHAFCYYCASSARLAEGSDAHRCPACDTLIESLTPVQQLLAAAS